MDRKIVKFSDNIKILRNKNGLSQEQMAEIFPVSRQTVSAREKGFYDIIEEDLQTFFL